MEGLIGAYGVDDRGDTRGEGQQWCWSQNNLELRPHVAHTSSSLKLNERSCCWIGKTRREFLFGKKVSGPDKHKHKYDRVHNAMEWRRVKSSEEEEVFRV